MQRVIIFSALFIIVTSCNYKLLVNKNRVYNTRTGYLLFFHRQNFFFPTKHIEGNNFFTSEIKKGYLIDLDKEENVLYDVGEKYVIDYQDLYNGEKSLLGMLSAWFLSKSVQCRSNLKEKEVRVIWLLNAMTG